MQLKYEVQLKPYQIPNLSHLIRILKDPTFFTDQRKDILEEPLCWENYTEKFELLLYLEEHWRTYIFGYKFRLNWQIQHRAAEFADELAPVLFPTAPPSPAPPAPLRPLKLFDWKLEGNLEQYEAVQHIVKGSSKPAPYLVLGPPGTGKTMTIVEAIKQIANSQPHSHILVCAHTNVAADQLCTKILKHLKHSVFRMYAQTHNSRDVPKKIRSCWNWVGDRYNYPAKEKLMTYKIIITTLFTASRLVSGNIPRGHFTHVFVDEAGDILETECIVPLAGLFNPESGQVVLAGDPKPLETIVKSRFAKEYGLGVSLLERLMTTCPLYQKNKGNFGKRFVTKLSTKQIPY